MKEIPILYSTPMVKAKLEGRKTQTRRTRGLEKINLSPDDWNIQGAESGETGIVLDVPKKGDVSAHFINRKTGEDIFVKCPYGKPGDLIWVRETLRQNGELGLEYLANGQWIDENIIPENHKPYRNYAHCNIPSIHMPKWAARIWDQLIDVRLERLQSISYDDCMAEGVNGMGFRPLWESINGNGSWDANPWVWVLQTKTLSTEGRPAKG